MIDTADLSLLVQGCTVSPGVGSLDAPRDLGFDSAVEAETGILLYALALRLHAQVIVETGTNRGYSASFLAMALKHLNQFQPAQRGLWTVDKKDTVHYDTWQTLGLEGLIRFSVHDSLTWDPDLPGPIDFLWLDAGHSADEVAGEFAHFLPCTRQGTIVAIHDGITNPGVPEALIRIHGTWSHKIEGQLSLPGLRGLELITLR